MARFGVRSLKTRKRFGTRVEAALTIARARNGARLSSAHNSAAQIQVLIEITSVEDKTRVSGQSVDERNGRIQTIAILRAEGFFVPRLNPSENDEMNQNEPKETKAANDGRSPSANYLIISIVFQRGFKPGANYTLISL